MVQLVTAEGEEGLLSRTLAFNGSPQDIKVAWGDHYSDIVRASLFPSSQASAFPASPSFPPSATHLRRPSPSLCLPLSLESLDRGATERGREREREGRREKKSPYQNSWSVPASPCRKSISQSANFHSYTSLEIGTRAGFQSREFPSTPSRLFFSPSPLSPQSLLRFNRRLRDPPLRKWTRREESLNGS